MAQICQSDFNQNRHPRRKRIHILAKRLTSTPFLDSDYIWKKVNKKTMDRTFLIHTLYSRGSMETLSFFFFSFLNLWMKFSTLELAKAEGERSC